MALFRRLDSGFEIEDGEFWRTTIELWKGEGGSCTKVGEYRAVELMFGSSGLTLCSKSESGDDAREENVTGSNDENILDDWSSMHSTWGTIWC